MEASVNFNEGVPFSVEWKNEQIVGNCTAALQRLSDEGWEIVSCEVAASFPASPSGLQAPGTLSVGIIYSIVARRAKMLKVE